MDIITGLNSGLYRLGVICKRLHDFKSTGKSVRYVNGKPSCVLCQRVHAILNSKNQNEKLKAERNRVRNRALVLNEIKVSVYGLIDPRTNKCFYVGRTSQALSIRLKDHLVNSRKSKCKKALVIKQLKSLELKPTIQLFAEEICQTKKDVEQFEQTWIDWIGLSHNICNEVTASTGAIIGEYGRILDPEILKKLGTNPDPVIARELNCTTSNVYAIRRNLGIPAYSTYFQWDEKALALLGTQNDKDVAGLLGITDAMVFKKRKELNIAGFPQFKEVWTEEVISMLGKVFDSVIAKKIGLTQTGVAAKRRKMKIPSFRESV